MMNSRELTDENFSQLNAEINRLKKSLGVCKLQLKNNCPKEFGDSHCRHYAYVVENAPVSVVITDTNGIIEFVNPKFEKVSGYSSGEVIGKRPSILKSGESEDEEYADLWLTIAVGETWSGVFHNRRKNGELYWERAVITGIRDEAGVISHYIAIKEDITAIREAREKLEHKRLNLVQQSKLAEVGLLTSGILHEVANPMAAIRGIICNVKDSITMTEDAQVWHKLVDQQLEQVLGEVDRITSISMDISEMAYSSSATIELDDVNVIINTTCRLVQYDSSWKAINLQLILDPALPAINFTKGQLSQVLINLMGNAAHAVIGDEQKAPSVLISTQLLDGKVVIKIKDNGCGIAATDLPKVFDHFFTSKDPGEGTGLGLALSKSIIEEHNGTIQISSTVGVGTEVSIHLPVEFTQEI